MTDDEKRNLISQERDGLQSQLDEIRELRMKLGLKSRDDRRAYLTKLGELSLLVGAAIIPVVVVAKNTNIPFKGFAIVGVFIYLLNGLLAFWRVKTLIYQDAEDSPQVGIDVEIQLQPLIHGYNKLIHDPSSEQYIEEYRAANLEFTKNLTPESSDKNISRIDPSADLVLYGFILATLLVVRVQWPFSNLLYWISMAMFGVGVIILLIIGYYKAKLARKDLENKRKLIAKSRDEYQKWQDREVLGK